MTYLAMNSGHQFYEEAVGLSDEPSYGARLGSTLAQAGIGAVVATIVAPEKDKISAIVGGAVGGIAFGAIGQAILPLSGIMYWMRALMVPAGAGVLVGLYLMRQYKRELGYSVAGRPRESLI
jgi:hypothetical protein